jgi:hypothetical protein
MAGISVTLSGDNIQLSFRKGDQSTAVVMDGPTAQSLHEALGKLLAAIGVGEAEEEIFDATSPIDIGLDEAGQPIISLQAGPLPSFLLRLKDEEARHIAESLLEIINAPRDARTSQGGH